MPKSRKVEKHNNRIVRLKVPTKLRVGPRKGGKSALLMSTEELQAALNNTNKKRYHNKIRAVLAKRKQ